MPDQYTVQIQYKDAGASFVSVSATLGDAGVGVEPGSKVAYWSNPDVDRAGVEITDEQIKLIVTPDAGNVGVHLASITSVEQIDGPDGTGDQGDVKISYTLA